jgi:hypothetical protein
MKMYALFLPLFFSILFFLSHFFSLVAFSQFDPIFFTVLIASMHMLSLRE